MKAVWALFFLVFAMATIGIVIMAIIGKLNYELAIRQLVGFGIVAGFIYLWRSVMPRE